MLVYVIYRTWAGAPTVTENLHTAALAVATGFEHPEAISLEAIEAQLEADLIDPGDDSVWTFYPEEGFEEHIQVYKVEMI